MTEISPLIRANMRKRYDSLSSPIHCRCLNQSVHLTARGFHHLLYNGSGKARSVAESQSKLTLIPAIIPVLQLATEATYEKKYVRKNSKKDHQVTQVEMWGLEADIGRRKKSRIKVIIRRDGGGRFFFWSVMRVR